MELEPSFYRLHVKLADAYAHLTGPGTGVRRAIESCAAAAALALLMALIHLVSCGCGSNACLCVYTYVLLCLSGSSGHSRRRH